MSATSIKKQLLAQEAANKKEAEEAAQNVDVPENVEEYSDDIKNAGNNILAQGKVIKFLLQQYHKNHIGDNVAGNVLFYSFASGSSLTSHGIQPGISGDAQTGKTDAMKAALHCCPKYWSMDTGLSDKAAFYIEFRSGQVVFSDDIIWTEGLNYMLKEAMSDFQPGASWTTVMKIDGELKSVTKTISPRVLWWLTSADGAPDEQIESRQYPLEVDTSISHATGVSGSIFSRRQDRKIKYSVDRGILIARYILDQVRQNGPFKVVIPYARRIDYKIKKDYRGQDQFLDFIDALAILNYQQREIQDGFIVATIEDFDEAKTVFSAKNESHVTGLTGAELELVRCMTTRDSWTQADLAVAVGKSQSVISRRLTAIMGKTAYITKSRGEHGEDIYKLAGKIDLSIFSNVIVEMKPEAAEAAAA